MAFLPLIFRRAVSCLRLCPIPNSGLYINPMKRQEVCEFHTSAIVLGGRKKSFWRQYKRHPAHTRLRPDKPERTKARKAFGGHQKVKAMRINKGLYEWSSEDIQLETPIVQVIHNTANKDFTRKGIMVKGTVVQIGAEAFNTWLEENRRGECRQDSEIQIEQNVQQQLTTGALYAKITSRPGQEGACNGRILEGEELEKLLSKPEFHLPPVQTANTTATQREETSTPDD